MAHNLVAVRGRPRYGCGKWEIGHPRSEANSKSSSCGMFIGMNVLLSKLMCKPEKAAKEERMSLRQTSWDLGQPALKDDQGVIGVLKGGTRQGRG